MQEWFDWIEQITLEGSFIYISILFFVMGLFAFGWLAVHVEHGRHFSNSRVFFATVLGSLLLGFAFHFLLLAYGM
ncbi:MAG: hypothetical protein R6V83_04085 [Candidatus Thorarchaeota archaeon]